MAFKKNIPNIITSLRIIGALCIPFLTPLSILFFVVYTLTGVTDIFDGFIARKMNIASEFGARLDSIADLLFYTLTLTKLLPVLWKTLPRFIWFIVAVILILRTISYIIAAVKFHRFASHHTWANKVTGAFVFAIPYFLVTKAAVVFCLAVCVVGIYSTIEDLAIHIFSDAYNENTKSIFTR